jgi:hypothetical protein
VPLSQYWRSTLDLGDRVHFKNYLLYLEYNICLDYIDCLVYFLPLQLGWINVT